MMFTLNFEFKIISDTKFEQVDELFTDFVDAYFELEENDSQLLDNSFGLDIAKMVMDVSVTVVADDLGKAINKSLSAIRTVAHDLGWGTPGWETAEAELKQSHVNMLFDNVAQAPVYGLEVV